MFATKIGAFIMAPFLMFSAWFGGHATVPPTHTPTPATSTTATNASASTSLQTAVTAWKNTHHFGPGPVILPPTHGATTSPTASLMLNSVLPGTGTVGSTVTLTGTGFTSDSIVHFGGGVVTNPVVNSDDSITFTVPSSVGPYCQPHMMCPMYMMLIQDGTYNVSVTDSNGTSNTESFTVTGAANLNASTKVNL